MIPNYIIFQINFTVQVQSSMYYHPRRTTKISFCTTFPLTELYIFLYHGYRIFLSADRYFVIQFIHHEEYWPSLSPVRIAVRLKEAPWHHKKNYQQFKDDGQRGKKGGTNSQFLMVLYISFGICWVYI